MTKIAGIILYFFLATALPYRVMAQRHYVSGYVVLQEGDTLYGKIKDRKPEPFDRIYEKIRFRDGGWFAKKFGPYDLQSYKAGERVYESCWLSYEVSLFNSRIISIPGRGHKCFMRVLVKGPLSYYSIEQGQDESGYYNDIPYLKLEGKREMVRATQGIFGLKRKQLAEYFSDCERLERAIQDKEVDTVFEIVDFYHDHCEVNLYYNPDYRP